MKGRINNRSSKELWVVETDTGTARAHKLAPNHGSPASVDADGFKAVDGTPVDGHQSWVKVRDTSTADVSDGSGGSLTNSCWTCSNVGENEFGTIQYLNAPGWGTRL